MIRHRISVTAVFLGATMLLGGCSGQPGIEALERPAVSEDALPTGINMGGNIKAESARLLTTHDQIRYFVATSSDSTEGCVIIVPAGQNSQSFAGCGLLGASDVIVTAAKTPGKHAAALVRDYADTRALESDGWLRIHGNILIPAQ